MFHRGFIYFKAGLLWNAVICRPLSPSDVLAAEMWAAAEVSVCAEGILAELWSTCLRGNSSPLNVGWKYFFIISQCNTNSQCEACDCEGIGSAVRKQYLSVLVYRFEECMNTDEL